MDESQPQVQPHNNMTPLIVIIALVLIGGAIGYKMMQKGTTETQTMTKTPETTSAPATSPTTTQATTDNANVKEFTITGGNFKYDLKEMKVKKGDTVKIVFKNAEGFHDWNLDEFNAHTQKIAAGKEETIQFTADKAGTFEFYCSVGTHRAMGMKGNFIVE